MRNSQSKTVPFSLSVFRRSLMKTSVTMRLRTLLLKRRLLCKSSRRQFRSHRPPKPRRNASCFLSVRRAMGPAAGERQHHSESTYDTCSRRRGGEAAHTARAGPGRATWRRELGAARAGAGGGAGGATRQPAAKSLANGPTRGASAPPFPLLSLLPCPLSLSLPPSLTPPAPPSPGIVIGPNDRFDRWSNLAHTIRLRARHDTHESTYACAYLRHTATATQPG